MSCFLSYVLMLLLHKCLCRFVSVQLDVIVVDWINICSKDALDICLGFTRDKLDKMNQLHPE